MKRIMGIMTGLLGLSAVAFAQQSVPHTTALGLALDDINTKLGTAYTLNGGQLSYQYNESRVTGDNLGCSGVASTNQNAYTQMTTRFDFNFDQDYEWEYRFAYEADGTLKTVICRMPEQSTAPTQTTPVETSIPADATSEATLEPQATVAPQATLDAGSAEPIYGRGGPRVLPLDSCGGADSALYNRLVNGGVGRVRPDSSPNNLRQSTDTNSARLGEIASGAVFTVMDGPFCNNQIAWYLVGDGVTPLGWTAEGRNGEYFLEPRFTDAAPIEVQNIANIQAYGGNFAPNVRAISGNAPDGTLLLSNGETIQRWRPVGNFTALDSLAWEVESEAAVHQWLFVSNSGQQWGADVSDGGSLMVLPLNDDTLSPYTQIISGRVPLLAIDNESSFAAVANGNMVSLVLIGRDGAESVVELTLEQTGDVTDVVFAPSGMSLIVATESHINIYSYEMGEGWLTEPTNVIEHDLSGVFLAVDESGEKIALSGTNADGDGVLRVIYTGISAAIPSSTEVALESGITAGKPAFNARGTLVAVYGSDNLVRLIDANTGTVVANLAANSSSTANQALGTGAVIFSRDGLMMWVASDGVGVQAFAIKD